MNMPLTQGQIAHADTVRELSDKDHTVLDRIAADIEAVNAPAIDPAACDAAGANEEATSVSPITGFSGDERAYAAQFLRGAFGADWFNHSDLVSFMLGHREGLRFARKNPPVGVGRFSSSDFAGNRSDSYPNVAGNRLDTLGHDTPFVKGGQGRNGLDIAESAKWLFVTLACMVVAYVLYRWANGGGA
mgnify:FL=1